MHIIEQYKHQTLHIHIHNCLNFVWMLERWAVVHLFLCLQFLMVTLTTTKLPDPGKMSLICLLMSLLLSLPLLVCLFLNWLKIQWRTHSWHIWVAASANACFVFWQINASFTYPWTHPLVWGPTYRRTDGRRNPHSCLKKDNSKCCMSLSEMFFNFTHKCH